MLHILPHDVTPRFTYVDIDNNIQSGATAVEFSFFKLR